jgi:hypothetical protein
MEPLNSSETSVLTRATWRNIPEDAILHSHCREILKSYIIKKSSTCGHTVRSPKRHLELIPTWKHPRRQSSLTQYTHKSGWSLVTFHRNMLLPSSSMQARSLMYIKYICIMDLSPTAISTTFVVCLSSGISSQPDCVGKCVLIFMTAMLG